MTNLALNLIEGARMYADKPTVRLDSYELTYTALDEASARLAQLLRGHGVAPGDRVGITLPNIPGAQATPEEIRDHVKGQVAAYKYPRHLWIEAALPKTATGKILRREIHPQAELDSR